MKSLELVKSDLLLNFVETRERNRERCYIRCNAIVFPNELDSACESYMYYLLWCISEERAAIAVTKDFFLIDTGPSILSVGEAVRLLGRELGVVELVMPGVIGGKMEERVWKAIDKLRVAEKEKRLNVYRKKQIYKNSN